MRDDLELVTVEPTDSPAIAERVAGILREAGIPAYVDGALLQDEGASGGRSWGASAGSSSGLLATGVHVPAGRLEEARRVLQEARERTSSPPDAAGAGPEAAEPLPSGEGDIIVWPRAILLEILVVILVALIPNLFYSFASLVLPDRATPFPFAYVYLSGLINGVVPAALVLFVIQKSGRR